MLGFGGSDKPKSIEEFNLDLWASLCVDFINAFSEKPLTKWAVMGNSIGGLLSLLITVNAPERVKGVVLFNASGGMVSFRDEELPFYIRYVFRFYLPFYTFFVVFMYQEFTVVLGG